MQDATILDIFKKAVIESVQAAGSNGAPSGPMYAAFMQYGIDLNAFQSLMDLLVKEGSLTQKGHVYYATKPR
jgi:hypothetical protein